MDTRPLVYILLGCHDSQRREILADLIDGGLQEGESALYFQPEGEPANDVDAKLAALESLETVTWKIEAGKVRHGSINAAPTHIFFLAPGDRHPGDTIEAVKEWADHNDCAIGRVLTTVHCSLLQEEPKTRSWFDACIHFADVVFLTAREGVDSKWLKDFEVSHKKAHFPTRFMLLKKGRVTNPVAALDPQARRMSLYFDELIPIDEDSAEDEDELPEDRAPDKYLERLENGSRKKVVPEITKFLKEVDHASS